MGKDDAADAGPWDEDPPPVTARFRCTGPLRHVVVVDRRRGDPCPERDGAGPCPGTLKDW